MRKIKALLKLGIKDSFQYRFNLVISLLTLPLSLMVYWFLWKSIYAYTQQSVIRGFSFELLISYFAISTIVAYISHSSVDEWMAEDIRNGDISLTLVKPLNFFSSFFYIENGSRLITIAVVAIPLFIVSVFFFYVKIYSIFALAAFIISTMLAFFITFMLAFYTGISAFWLKKIGGLRRFRRGFLSFLGGGLIPLTFFPVWFQSLSYFLPFQYTRFVPINNFIGRYTPSQSILLILVQLVWAAALYFISLIFLKVAIKKTMGEGI